MDQRIKIVGLALLMVALSGCVNINSTMTMNENGEPQDYQVTMEFSEAAWGMMESFMASSEYDDMETWLLEEGESQEQVNGESYLDCGDGAEETAVDEDARQVTLTCTDIVVTNDSMFETTVSDNGDTVTYRDSGVIQTTETNMQSNNMSMGDGGFNFEQPQYTHTVVMPGEITDSNAHEVDGQRATWNLSAFDGEEIYAESGTEEGVDDVELGSDIGGDQSSTDGSDDGSTDGDDQSDGDGDDNESSSEESADDNGSGFTVVVTAVAVLLGLVAVARRR